MKFVRFILIIFLIPAISQLDASENKIKKMLIYRGPGTCDGCSESIGKIVKKMGYKIQYVKPGELTKENFTNAAMYIQPGGSDRILDTLESLSQKEIKNLQKFIAQGGSYLGVCAGGYLAGMKTDDDNGEMVPAFGLIPITVDEESDSADAKIETINWQGKDYSVYFQAGPKFDIANIPNAKSFGFYKSSQHSMAFIAPYGQGQVGLIGAHLEATKDWFIEDHLPVPKRLTAHLMIEFINNLLVSNEKSGID